MKFVAEASGEKRKQYRTSLIRLSCAGQGRIGLAHLRGLRSNEIAAPRSIVLSVEGERLSFPRAASMAKIDSLETGRFEARYTSAPYAFFDAAATTGGSMNIVESDPTETAGSPRIVKLSTDGLAKALERLKKACDARQSPAADSVGSPAAR